MPIYLDFVNVSIRIYTEIPVGILQMIDINIPTYWFIKFSNNYGPQTLSGILSETSRVPMSGLLNSKGLISESNNINNGTSFSGLSNVINVTDEGGVYHYKYPIPIAGLFNFTFYISSPDYTVMMSPISILINSDQILNITNSRVIEIFKKYEGMKITYNDINNADPSYLYYIDLNDNIVKSADNSYYGIYAPLSASLSIAPTSDIQHTYYNSIFNDPITGLSLAVDRRFYNSLISKINPNRAYIQDKKYVNNKMNNFLYSLVPYGLKPNDSYPISTLESFTDKFDYNTQPEAIFNPSPFLQPVYDVDPAINESIVNDLTNNDSINIPLPTIQSVINDQMADIMITDPSVMIIDTNNKPHTEVIIKNNKPSILIWVIILIIVLAIIVLFLNKKYKISSNV